MAAKANVNKEEVKVSEEQIAEVIKNGISTSAKIRGLNNLGLKCNEIHKCLIKYNVTTKKGSEIRYQHVRNILIMDLANSKE